MRLPTAMVLLFAPLLLGGCGGSDDIEVNLPFVGNIMEQGKVKEEKMASRGSLVLPPNTRDLPEPLDGQTAPRNENWPVDPDEKARAEAKTAALKEKQYQKDGDWKGERNSGNGLEDFKNKIDWSRRQPGIFRSILNKPQSQ